MQGPAPLADIARRTPTPEPAEECSAALGGMPPGSMGGVLSGGGRMKLAGLINAKVLPTTEAAMKAKPAKVFAVWPPHYSQKR
jgi:hypothetical protein